MTEIKLLNHLEIEYTPNSDNVKIECLWCGEPSLSIDTESPHQFQCFKCKESGNAFSFLRRFYTNLPNLVKADAVRLCQLKRGIKPNTLRDTGVRCTQDVYWFPAYNNKGNLISLHKYNANIPKSPIYGSPKPTSLSVLGLNTQVSTNNTTWVAEGHWDYLTLYPMMKDTGINLLGTCGSFFSSNLLSNLKNRHVVLLYDNDQAGKDGIYYVAKHLKANSIPILSLSYLDWTKITLTSGNVPDKFDVRDLHNEYC